MNSEWQVCQKPFASFYRFGKVVIDTPLWFYSGRVMDFYLTDSLQMTGMYSPKGSKDGIFGFYYPNGKLESKGQYIYNKRHGIWKYYYPSGDLKLRINYAGDGKNFTVIDYIDPAGKVLLKDSTGNFEMTLNFLKTISPYRLEGAFKNGKRSGTWKYYGWMAFDKTEKLLVKEVYENGELKKGTMYDLFDRRSDNHTVPIDQTAIELDKLLITESFLKHPISFPNTEDDQDLADYLISKKAPEFNVEAESFGISYMNVLQKLNTAPITNHFVDPNKIYKGEIIFNLSDSGDIKEVEIKGNLSEKEREYMLFFIKKFRNIHEIVVENVGIDAYHTIHFYTVIFADFIPERYLYILPEKIFMFTLVSYEKLAEAMREAVKKKKDKKN